MPKRNLKYDHDVDHGRPLPSIVDETGTLKDEIKLSDFENDLFYEKEHINVVETLADNITDVFSKQYNRDYPFTWSTSKKTLDAGAMIKITFDGVEHICELKGGWYTKYVGNNSLVEDWSWAQTDIPSEIVDTGEPFFIGIHSYEFSGMLISVVEEGKHTITVDYIEVETEIKQIESKYIPGALIVETDTVYYVEDDLLGKAIKTAVQNGQMVCIYYQDTYYYPINIKLNVYNYGQTFVTVLTCDSQFSFKV